MMEALNPLPMTKIMSSRALPQLTAEQKKDCKKVEQTAKEFASVFYYKVVEAMRKPVMPDPITGVGGKSEALYDTLLNEYYATGIAQQDRSQLIRAIAYSMSRGTACEAVFNPYERYLITKGNPKKLSARTPKGEQTTLNVAIASKEPLNTSRKQVPYEQRTQFWEETLELTQSMGGDHESKSRNHTPPN